jgi:hypothetical protein
MENDNTAIDRLDRSLEKMSDKLDAVVTSVNDLKIHVMRIETKLSSQEEKANKETSDLWEENRRLRENEVSLREYVDQKDAKLEERIKAVEDKQQAFMQKYGVPLSAIMAIGAMVASAWILDYTNSRNPLVSSRERPAVVEHHTPPPK